MNEITEFILDISDKLAKRWEWTPQWPRVVYGNEDFIRVKKSYARDIFLLDIISDIDYLVLNISQQNKHDAMIIEGHHPPINKVTEYHYSVKVSETHIYYGDPRIWRKLRDAIKPLPKTIADRIVEANFPSYGTGIFTG